LCNEIGLCDISLFLIAFSSAQNLSLSAAILDLQRWALDHLINTTNNNYEAKIAKSKDHISSGAVAAVQLFSVRDLTAQARSSSQGIQGCGQ
jgi:hypothetical protein